MAKKITEKTIIQIDLKTLIIVSIFIISSIGGAYWKLSADMSNGLSKVQEQVTGISNQVNIVDGKVQGLVLTLRSSEQNVQPTNNRVQNQVPGK